MVQNVLLITVDSLRWDVAIGNRTNLGSLYDNGVCFSCAFATGPGTQPSFPAILTGTHLLSYAGVGALTKDRPRVAYNLQEDGLSTGGFQSNPFLSEQFNYHEGFSTYRDYQNPLMGVATKVFPRGIEVNNPKLKLIDDALGITDKLKRGYQLFSGKARPYVSADIITDDTLQWLERINEPFFCWAHYMDVHHPCHPPREYRERYGVEDVTVEEVSKWYSALIKDPDRLNRAEINALLALYDSAIDYTDDQIGRLIDRLKESGRYENTLVVVTSDHGEMFGEYGEHGKPPRMYDELLRVPLIVVNGPSYLKEATEELVSLVDIPPLMHDALGLSVPEKYEGVVPGRGEPRTYVIGEHEIRGQPVVGARSETVLYEYDASEDEERVYEVTDGTATPADGLDAPAELHKIVSERLKQFDSDEEYNLKAEVEDDVEERLEGLGYL